VRNKHSSCTQDWQETQACISETKPSRYTAHIQSSCLVKESLPEVDGQSFSYIIVPCLWLHLKSRLLSAWVSQFMFILWLRCMFFPFSFDVHMMAENGILLGGPYFLSDIIAMFKLITMHNKWDLFFYCLKMILFYTVISTFRIQNKNII
jgi:hypothetical protein